MDACLNTAANQVLYLFDAAGPATYKPFARSCVPEYIRLKEF